MIDMSALSEWIERASLANLTAVLVVVAGLGFAIYTDNTELASFIIGAGVTWLFDERNSKTE